MPPLVDLILPFLPESGAAGPGRPYLWLEVKGPNGLPVSIRGIIDTGADRSSLPAGYAQLLGMDLAQAALEQANQVSGGAFQVWTWPQPLSATIIGAQQYTFNLNPTFVPNSFLPLWGRFDFLALWEFTLDEASQLFRLRSKVEAN